MRGQAKNRIFINVEAMADDVYRACWRLEVQSSYTLRGLLRTLPAKPIVRTEVAAVHQTRQVIP